MTGDCRPLHFSASVAHKCKGLKLLRPATVEPVQHGRRTSFVSCHDGAFWCVWRSSRMRSEGDSWQMTFIFLSLSNFEDNQFLVIEWINWNQTQSRLIALLVIDVLFVCPSVFGVSIIWWTVGKPVTCIQLLSSENWNNSTECQNEGWGPPSSFFFFFKAFRKEEKMHRMCITLSSFKNLLHSGSLGYESVQMCHWVLILLLCCVLTVVWGIFDTYE